MTTICDNPRCACDPCVCVDCRCGSARLGDLERQVMEVLWATPDTPMRGRAIADSLPEYAYTTIATVLDRLSRKGEVQRAMEGRVLLYRATGSSGTHAAKAMREALDAAENPYDALAQLVDRMSSDELDAFRRALRSRR